MVVFAFIWLFTLNPTHEIFETLFRLGTGGGEEIQIFFAQFIVCKGVFFGTMEGLHVCNQLQCFFNFSFHK